MLVVGLEGGQHPSHLRSKPLGQGHGGARQHARQVGTQANGAVHRLPQLLGAAGAWNTDFELLESCT